MNRAIEPARPGDLSAIRDLLLASGLLASDISASSLGSFLVVREGPELAGVVGVDVAGPVGMLRSLAVPGHRRAQGLGRALVAAAESLAGHKGVRELYLLTTTADRFFAALDYHAAPRDKAPPAIQAMPQFKELCPASSAFMFKALAEP